ncbi:MAG: hypothetical protein Q7J34_01480 [Bacteroidales bacterium]|nr:hypothetical protein [Bacteroidales bacterium]
MKSIKYLFYCLFLFNLLTACSKNDEIVIPDFNLQTPDNLDIDEYKIYSLILNEVYTASEHFVVKQQTSTSISISINDSYYAILLANTPNLDTTIFANFIERNDSAYQLAYGFSGLIKPITLISEEETDFFFNNPSINKSWETFYKKYPNSNGMIDFTRVGFNADKSQAIVEFGHYYASLGANGSLVYLVKEDNKWVIIKLLYTWIS